MQTRTYKNVGPTLSLLGMGCMRLPQTAGDDPVIDEATAQQMVDTALARGINYFDTAYFYHNGQSEPFVGKALAKYDRDSFYLATKMPVYSLKTPEDAPRIFAEQLARTAQRAIRGGAGTEAQESFRNILSAFLVNESVFMPLNHMILPLLWNGRMAFSEVWVDPDAEENLKQGRGERDNVIRFLFKIDIQGLGFFDMVLTCQRERVDIQLFCPERVAPFSGLVQGELSRILSDNGLTAGAVQVQQMDRPLTISGVFPRIFEGENSINVKI